MRVCEQWHSQRKTFELQLCVKLVFLKCLTDLQTTESFVRSVGLISLVLVIFYHKSPWAAGVDRRFACTTMTMGIHAPFPGRFSNMRQKGEH